MNNIQQVSDAYLCSACGACNAVCPKEAIQFSWSNIGRKYAVVNENCVECGLCLKVCPSLDNYHLMSDIKDKYVGDIKSIDIGRSLKAEIYRNAQSGGVCTALLAYLFETGKIDGAIVCKMDFGSPPTVTGIIVTSASELLQTQKSCYTPVDLLSALKFCQNFKSLAIVGLPCHMEAVENLVRTSSRFRNITYRLGLICDRTLAAGIQDYICTLFPSNELCKIHWRGKGYQCENKAYSYKSAPTSIHFKEGASHIIPRHVRISLKDMFTPPRCRVCFDKLNIFSDITLGDPWGMSGVDWENGDNLILTRTDTGKQLLAEAQSQRYVSIKMANKEEMLRGQVIDRKRESVPRFSEAYRTLPFAMESPILQSFNGNTKKEFKQLLDFIQSEQKTKEQIIEQAHSVVRKYERGQQLPYRIWNKFKNLTTKILKR